MPRLCFWSWFPLAMFALYSGCNGPEFAEVEGHVKLDGQPLVFATVEFQPEEGSPAYGVTDDSGHYKLEWSASQSGAPIGKHQVRITSFRESKPRERERVPVRYNRQTELIREVRAGLQQIDFELTSD